jgi:O-methyltransferase
MPKLLLLNAFSTSVSHRDQFMRRLILSSSVVVLVLLCLFSDSVSQQFNISLAMTKAVLGEDVPWQAHTMIGCRRLESLRHCVESVIQDRVPGDLIELGVLRGGASIFMRGVLRAYNDVSRKVYACDTYVPRMKLTPAVRQYVLPVVSMLASIPIRPFQKWLCTEFIRKSGSFPAVDAPSDELINMTLFTLQNVSLMSHHRGTGLDDVKSNFARYGLLDDQVVFLQGFFSDTLPKAPIDKVSVLRLDGDTFESTRDVLALLYKKLSPGGFCVIDDYNTFADCQRAVDDFRTANGIEDAIVPIDKNAVYWRRSF